MPKRNDYAELVRARVTMPEAIARYVPDAIPRKNRIPCPIHAGRGYNLGFTERVYHCFVCGSAGDVIGFTRHCFGLDFQDALEKRNRDFGLGLPAGRKPTLREVRDLGRRAEQLRRRRVEQDAARLEWEARYWRLLDEWIALDLARRVYAPKAAEEPIDARYAEALRRIDRAAYRFDLFLSETTAERR